MSRLRTPFVVLTIALLALGACSGGEGVDADDGGHTVGTRAPLVEAGTDDGSDEGADGGSDGEAEDASAGDDADPSGEPAAGADGEAAAEGGPGAPDGGDLCGIIGVLAADDDPVFGSSDLFSTPAPALRDSFARSARALDQAVGAAPETVRGDYALLAQVVGDLDGVLGAYDHDIAAMLGADDPAVVAGLAALDSAEYDQAVVAIGAHAGSACDVTLG